MKNDQHKQEKGKEVFVVFEKNARAKKVMAVSVLTVILFGTAYFQAEARTRDEKIVRYYRQGVQLIEVVKRRLNNKDIARNANISYKKLNLRN
jgi:hypothetical protein